MKEKPTFESQKKATAQKSDSRLMTKSDAKAAHLDFAEPKPIVCPWCNRELEQLGTVFNDCFHWVSHEKCGCSGEIEEERKQEERKKKAREAAIAKRVASSGVSARYKNAQTALPEIASYLNRYGESAGEGLFIHGGVGSGKTYAAMALARALIYADYSVIVTTTTAMLNAIADTYGKNSTSVQGLGRYVNCEMLVLDDMGKENANGWAVNTLFQIVNARYEAMLSTVVTSQYTLDALEKRIGRGGEKESAQAIVSRLRQTCKKVCLGTQDLRKRSSCTQK